MHVECVRELDNFENYATRIHLVTLPKILFLLRKAKILNMQSTGWLGPFDLVYHYTSLYSDAYKINKGNDRECIVRLNRFVTWSVLKYQSRQRRMLKYYESYILKSFNKFQ